MSRFVAVIRSRPVFARACTALGFLAVTLSIGLAGQTAFASPSVPEIDPLSIGSALGVVVGTLAMLEGRSRRRSDR